MKILYKILAICLISVLFVPLTMASESNNSGNASIQNTAIIKEIPTKVDLDTFISTLPDSSNFVNVSANESKRLHPTWPHDVWVDSREEYYISFYYKVQDVEYKSIYYDNCGNKLGKMCGIELSLFAPYYGLNVTNSTDHEVQVNNSSVSVNESPMIKPTSQNINNDVIQNSTVAQGSGNNSDSKNNVNNSTGVVNIQGNGNVVKQTLYDHIILELSNIKDSVINIHF